MDICWIIDTIGCAAQKSYRRRKSEKENKLYKLTIDDSHVLKKEPEICRKYC